MAFVAPIITPVTVTNVAQTLAQLKGSALADDTKHVALRVFSTGVAVDDGGGTYANSCPLNTDDWVGDGDKTTLGSVTFITGGAAIAAWLVERG